MYQSHRTQQPDHHQQTTSGPLASSFSTLSQLYYLEKRPRKHNYQDQNHNHSHERSRHYRQNHKARHRFARHVLVLITFLSVIKDSLTTTYTTLYIPSLDATTTAPQTNSLPYFDFDVPRNVTVTVGQTGFLHCRVERLGDKDVSWIRKRDLHILTAGSTTYTSDQRFQVLRPENSGNWTLQIKYPQLRDAGIYECQINTEPKMSLSYTFNVVELKAAIFGPTDLYVKSGSDINLTCKLTQGPHELGNIFWYKGSEIIDVTTNLNEIDSGTRITVESDWSDGLTSRLKIRRASSSDTGNYTCVPTIAKSASVYVHVIIGEHPAAMQHNAGNTHCASFYINLCCVLLTILTCCLQHLICTSSVNGDATETATTARTTLATKGASYNKLPLPMPNANASATSQFSAVRLTCSTSVSTPRTKATIEGASAASVSTQLAESWVPLAACTKSSMLLYTATVGATTSQNAQSFACNGRITR